MSHSLPKAVGLATSLIVIGFGISKIPTDPKSSAYLLLLGLFLLSLLISWPYTRNRLVMALGTFAAANVVQALMTGFVIGLFRRQLGWPIGIDQYPDWFQINLAINVVVALLLLWLAFSTRNAHGGAE